MIRSRDNTDLLSPSHRQALLLASIGQFVPLTKTQALTSIAPLYTHTQMNADMPIHTHMHTHAQAHTQRHVPSLSQSSSSPKWLKVFGTRPTEFGFGQKRQQMAEQLCSPGRYSSSRLGLRVSCGFKPTTDPTAVYDNTSPRISCTCFSNEDSILIIRQKRSLEQSESKYPGNDTEFFKTIFL